MSKKDDRIDELTADLADATAELTATKIVLRGVADVLGVDLGESVTIDSAPALLRRMQASITIARIAEVPPKTLRHTVTSAPWETFDGEVDEQINRMKEQGLTEPRAPRQPDTRDDFEERTTLTMSTQPFQADSHASLRAIGQEMGLHLDQMSLGDALSAIHTEIVRVKSMGADVEAESSATYLAKGDTLSEAVIHHHQQNAELRDGAAQARAIVNRVAAAMQVAHWDKDGTELLERVQRYEGWKHVLKRRIREIRRCDGARFDDSAPTVADELQAQLKQLMSAKEWSDWLKSQGTGINEVVKARMPDIDVPPYPESVNAQDLTLIQRALRNTAGVPAVRNIDAMRYGTLAQVMDEIVASRVATDAFVGSVNGTVLPIVARLKAAQRPADAE